MDKYLISAKIAIFLQITTFTLSNDVNLFFRNYCVPIS